MSEDFSLRALDKLMDMVQDIKHGLDPNVLASWYQVIESEAKTNCPAALRDTIAVIQDPILPLKFQLKASKRAVGYVLEAIENHLAEMPFATRLYFQKLEEIIEQELRRASSAEGS